jgi:hypothetical protein
LLRRVHEALAKTPVVRVDEELLAGLGILEHEEPQVGQFVLQRIVQPHRDHLVAPRELREGPVPARIAEEVGDQEKERPAVDVIEGALEERVELRALSFGQRRPRAHRVQDAQHLAAAGLRPDDLVDVGAVEDRAHAITVPREEASQQGDEIHRHGRLLHFLRAEVDRAGKVEQEPGGDLAILVVLAHVRRLQPRRHVPVDVPHVVAVLVLAQVGEVEPVAAEECAVVTLQQAIQPADDRPFEALQDRVRTAARRLGWRRWLGL